mmetsp:Transcript_89105/g.250886  ORF Transcript_89105/g.250886 Transcript_89105/m.250886 type:complete len:326 (+) Transcript_89105:102-1079(+)
MALRASRVHSADLLVELPSLGLVAPLLQRAGEAQHGRLVPWFRTERGSIVTLGRRVITFELVRGSEVDVQFVAERETATRLSVFRRAAGIVPDLAELSAQGQEGPSHTAQRQGVLGALPGSQPRGRQPLLPQALRARGTACASPLCSPQQPLEALDAVAGVLRGHLLSIGLADGRAQILHGFLLRCGAVGRRGKRSCSGATVKHLDDLLDVRILPDQQRYRLPDFPVGRQVVLRSLQPLQSIGRLLPLQVRLRDDLANIRHGDLGGVAELQEPTLLRSAATPMHFGEEEQGLRMQRVKAQSGLTRLLASIVLVLLESHLGQREQG